MTIWDLQDKFHDAQDDDEGREAARDEMRDAGFHGVANTIRPVSEGGTDWRRERS
jgi:hypothetical protein